MEPHLPGTNYFTKLDDNVQIALTEKNGRGVFGQCDGNPNVVALHPDTYVTGFIMRRIDLTSGNNLYQNTGTLAVPIWTLVAGGGGGAVLTKNSVTGDGLPGTEIELVNDQLAPLADYVYGTDSGGVKGWKPDPTGPPTGPASPDKAVQYNRGGVFGADANFTRDYSNQFKTNIKSLDGFGSESQLYIDGSGAGLESSFLTVEPFAGAPYAKVSIKPTTNPLSSIEVGMGGAVVKAEASLTGITFKGNTDYQFPITDGNVGEVLITDGAGNVDWGSSTSVPFFTLSFSIGTWVLNGPNYEILLIHNLNTTNTTITTRENGIINTLNEVLTINPNNTLISVPANPDLRFAGEVLILGS